MQFEKEVDEDPFGLNKFLTEAKKAKRPAESSRFVFGVMIFTAFIVLLLFL